MRSFGNPRASLMAAMAIALAGNGLAQAAMPAPRKGGHRDYKPSPPRLDSAVARAIADHNAEVDRRKAEKKARKRQAQEPTK
jgi:hypothetical protein